MKTIKIITIAVMGFSILSMTSSLFADVPVAKGGYIEGNFGITNTNQSDSSSNALGFNVNLGYKFMPFVSGEFGYTSYGSSESSFTGSHAYDLVVKGVIPFPEAGVEIFAKLGAGWVSAANGDGDDDSDDSNGTNANVYFGFGGAYAVTPNMLIVLEWNQANSNNNSNNLQLLSIGANYIFS